jgi:thioredoxin-related protein
MKKTLTYLLICLAMYVNAAIAKTDIIAFATDLQKDGRIAAQQHVPILIIFTSPDCHYCERVMNNFLIPMQRNPEYAHKVMMRRVEINNAAKLIGFDGSVTTQQAYAATQKARFTPTVMVYTPNGISAADPLVGLGPEEYYGTYLDGLIDAGVAKASAH